MLSKTICDKVRVGGAGRGGGSGVTCRCDGGWRILLLAGAGSRARGRGRIVGWERDNSKAICDKVGRGLCVAALVAGRGN